MLKWKNWRKTANNPQKDSEKLFFDNRATKNKPLISYKAILRIWSYSKTVFKNFSSALTTNEISPIYDNSQKDISKIDLLSSHCVKKNLCGVASTRNENSYITSTLKNSFLKFRHF